MSKRSIRACGWRGQLRGAFFGVLVLIVAGCAPTPEGDGSTSTEPDDLGAPALDEMRAAAVASPDDLPETHSLLGEPLFRPELDPDFHDQQEMLLQLAVRTYAEDRSDPRGLIWIGRRLSYLGFYRRAQWVYTRAIETYDEEPEFYRHRGHRYITLRRFPQAIADLERAAELIEGTEDRVEVDGLPNARQIPTSTLHTNIWYHLGLARYLIADWQGAAEAYRQGLTAAANPDMQVAMTYWLHMTLRRLGEDEEAGWILEPITADLDIIENQLYHRILRMLQGAESKEVLLADAREAGGGDLATLGYGVGAHYLLVGDEEKAFEIFREIVDTSAWPSFGYVAAEAELARDGDVG